MRFADRIDAGRRLAQRLEHLRGPDTIVLGLPRGGVPVAAQVARALDAPLDVIVVRKLGVPFQPELLPEGATGVVVFAHGSGSSRHSPRNRLVASVLGEAGLGTLLFDLLTPAEELDRSNVFDIGLLAGSLTGVTRWLRVQREARHARIGCFGASTGAAAALWAAAEPDARVDAIVSRGGRPDLAGPRLGLVRAPTLLIAGGRDTAVVELNRWARAQLRCENELAIVEGATHLFEEPGTLEAVAELARDWFLEHLVPAGQRAAG